MPTLLNPLSAPAPAATAGMFGAGVSWTDRIILSWWIVGKQMNAAAGGGIGF